MKWTPGQPVALSDEDKSAWDDRVERAERFAKPYHLQWEASLERYTTGRAADAHAVNPLLDFRHVEAKKAQLFYQTPEVQLIPVDPKIEKLPIQQFLPLRQKVLNYKLGPDAANVKREVHATLFDALSSSGFLALKIGYETRTVEVEQEPQISIDPMTGEMQVMELPPVEVPVWERCFISKIPPKRLLIPHDFKGHVYDDAAWLGIKGVMPLTLARQQPGWNIPDDYQGTTERDETRFTHQASAEGSAQADPQVPYTEIWYRAALFDPDVVHPGLYRCLILVEGLDAPVKHVDSPYHRVDPMGRMTGDSMVGSPIHLGTLRDLTDSAYVPSDLTIGAQLSEELTKFRTQQVRGRDRRQPITVFDTENLDQDTITKIEANRGPIPLPAGALGGGVDRLFATIGTGSEPRDNYTAQDYIQRDYETALGLGSNQQGVAVRKRQTATEARIVQGNSDARAEAERDRLREYFVQLVRKFDAVLQQYLGPEELTNILGQQAAQLWEQWKALPGRYLYKIQPDSGVHVDAVQYRAQALDEYNLLRKDPQVNTAVLLEKVARALNYDPQQFVAPPPEPRADAPNMSVSFKAEDLVHPVSGRVMLDLLVQSGYELAEDTIARLKQYHDAVGQQLGMGPTVSQGGVAGMIPPTPHGGSAPTMDVVNRHQQERTGGVQGMGVL